MTDTEVKEIEALTFELTKHHILMFNYRTIWEYLELGAI